MKLKNLKLLNFRNYGELDIDFFDGINVFYGENAQGKTNLLEACYLFSSAKSHRGARDRDMVKFDCDESRLNLEFISQNREQSAEMKLYPGKTKKLFINGIEQRYKKALFGVFSTVIFSPEDLFLIKEGPDLRRRFMDIDIAQLRPRYHIILRDYLKLADQKNNILKKDKPDLKIIDIYNEKMASLGAVITLHRHRFVEQISKLSALAASYISDGREDSEIIYAPDLNEEYDLNRTDIYNKYLKRLESVKALELEKRNCLAGPQRDDIKFFINKKDARAYASQGQQRSLILSLKLAEYEFMKEVLGEPPILLLDDILSELDFKRQEKLLKFIRENQTVITCTDKDIYKAFKYPYKLFRVEKGVIT